MKLSPHEVNRLSRNEGNLIAYKGFLSARRAKPSADCLDAHVEIECHVEQLSDEILFNVGTTFRVDTVERFNQGCRIRLTITDDGK